MIPYPDIDPVAISIGPLSIHWYGLMYLVGFVAAWFLGTYRARQPNSGWTEQQVSDLLFFGMVGVIVGGRTGYVLFYNFGQFLADPIWLFKIWTGGMSFHGGLLGVIAAIVFFAWKQKKHVLDIGDIAAPLVPLGLLTGRIGNFINGELWGRPTDVAWGVVFEPGGQPRHPSQLYEAALEGLTLFLLVWWFSSKPRPRGAVAGLFLAGYGSFRFFVEFFREPDAHIGFDLFNWMTRGQILSLPMIIAGVCLMVWAFVCAPRPGASVEPSQK